MAMLTYDMIIEAAERIQGEAVRTPMLRADALDRRYKCRLLFKPEPLQRTGSFKFRGAFNKVSQLSEPAVVAYSSGNHAQGVAAAAHLLGKSATIVMPEDSPVLKIERTKGWGAEVRLYDRYRESREAIGEQIAKEQGAALIRPFEDWDVMAGQGTAGLELAQDCEAQGIVPDHAIACCGGGGLTAGFGTALKHHFPDIEVHAAEPVTHNDTERSLAEGKIVENDPAARSICDAIVSPSPGEMTFSINQPMLKGALTASDEQTMQAMAMLFSELKIVAEPGGAIATAVFMAHADRFIGKTVLIMISGGNVDPGLYRDIFAVA